MQQSINIYNCFTLMQFNIISVRSCILPKSINCSSFMHFPVQYYAILVFLAYHPISYSLVVSCNLLANVIQRPFFHAVCPSLVHAEVIHKLCIQNLLSIQTVKYPKFTDSIQKRKKKKKGKEQYNHFTENIILSPTESCTIPRKHSWNHIITFIQKNMKKKSHIPKCKVKVHFFQREDELF